MDNTYFISIDPGLTCTGIAVWQKGEIKPIDINYIYPKDDVWEDKAQTIVYWLLDYVDESCLTKIFIEFPEYQGSTAGIAAQHKGDILKLAYLCGLIDGFSDVENVLINPSQWKGQLPKKICQKRITSYLGEDWVNTHKKQLNEHVWDAIGVGLYGQGIKIL